MKHIPGTDFVVRRWNPTEEWGLVLKTWLGCANASKTREHSSADPSEFRRNHHKAIERVIPRSELHVIVHKDAPEVVLGWLAWIPGKSPVIHFLFVKEAYRQQGVGTALLEGTLGPGWKARRVLYTHKLSRSSRSKDGTLPPIPPGWVHSIYPFYIEGDSHG